MCLEKHSEGGNHYHLSLKLTGAKRWIEAKRSFEEKHGIIVNFSDHEGYYSAYCYISKYDETVFHSRGHPNLDEVGSPRTKRCQQSYRKRRSAGQSEEKTGHAKKIQRLSNLEVFDFIVKEEIKTETELLAVANEQRQEGKKDLANFVLSRTSKSLNDLIEQTWKMRKASLTLERQKASRMDLIREAVRGD